MATLKRGDNAPDFALNDQNGNTVKLKNYSGRKLLLYFYPKALTPGCTTQSCNVRDAREDLSSAGVDCLGVSPDAAEKQKKFEEKYSLNFPLLSDEDHKLAEAFGTWGEKSMYGKKYMGIIRSAFLIDEDGKILEVWYKVSPADTVKNVRQVIKGGA